MSSSLFARCMRRSLALIICCYSSIAFAGDPIAGLGPVSEVTKVKGDFQFTEGPTKTPDGSLYFTDIPAESIFKLTQTGAVELFFKPSKFANGLMYGGGNRLLACQMDGQLVAIDLTNKNVTLLADKFNGQRFNACNDLVIDKQGGIYFTDPRYRAPEPWPQVKEAFYYRDPQGTVTRLGEDIAAPNGIILSPDEESALCGSFDAARNHELRGNRPWKARRTPSVGQIEDYRRQPCSRRRRIDRRFARESLHNFRFGSSSFLAKRKTARYH